VKHFLVVYDRPTQDLVRFIEFASSHQALAARFEAEREFETEPQVEIVVLSASSEGIVRRTHARYFETLTELLKTKDVFAAR
jgi:hypothetical protein